MSRLPPPPPAVFPLPVGVQFYPTDLELLDCYLRKKILCLRLPCGTIVDEDVYRHHPKCLTDRNQMSNRNCEWFFFTWTFRKLAGIDSGPSLFQSAGSGRWKPTEGIKLVFDSNNSVIGLKQSYEYMERSPSGEEKKSIWLMEEYSMPHLRTGYGSAPVTASMVNEWVLCKIYLTPEGRSSYTASSENSRIFLN